MSLSTKRSAGQASCDRESSPQSHGRTVALQAPNSRIASVSCRVIVIETTSSASSEDPVTASRSNRARCAITSQLRQATAAPNSDHSLVDWQSNTPVAAPLLKETCDVQGTDFR